MLEGVLETRDLLGADRPQNHVAFGVGHEGWRSGLSTTRQRTSDEECPKRVTRWQSRSSATRDVPADRPAR